ncbi:MAG: alginate export family protein [Ignavibacteriaceae bacterium]|nr:alginate export family protein [Ignavibacteriaceae bacterium]
MKSIFITIILISAIVTAQTDDWKITGGIQLRTELDGRDFYNKTYPVSFTSMRTRLGVAKNISGKAEFFLQAQDSRIFGQAMNTLAAINNLDLHQGYVKLSDLFESGVSLQAGRFEISYGTERFFGAVGWHYIGRSFDGVKLSYGSKYKVDAFVLTNTKSFNYVANATSGIYPFNAKPDTSFNIYGLWSTFGLPSGKMDLFGYYEINRKKSNATEYDLSRLTAGLSYLGQYGDYSVTTEAAIQIGKVYGLDNFAYFVSLSGDYKYGNANVGLGADILSGTDFLATDKYNSFDVSYGTNHKFYGFMDYFINVPVNTFGLGLHDFYIRYNLKHGTHSVGVDVHHFMSNKETTSGFNTYGQEVDVTLRYNFLPGTVLTLGASVFLPGDLMKNYFSSEAVERKDMAFWNYLMISSNF